MNKTQRYYAFLALTQNDDFIDDMRNLRKRFSFAGKSMPISSFERAEDADSFILSINEALQEGRIEVSEHPLWTLEQNLLFLMKKYGLEDQSDSYLTETAKHFFFLGKVVLFRDRFRLTYDRSREEVLIVLKKDTMRDDIEDNLKMIFDYKQEVLGKTTRKSEIFQFEQHLQFYKQFMLIQQSYPEWSDYQAINYLLEKIDANAVPSLPRNEFAGLGDQRKAYEVIRDFQQRFSHLVLLSSRDTSQI